jgi:heme exporter protein C
VKHWYKVLAVLLLGYTIVGGFLFKFPALPILNETIRNVFFHIPMWYVMIICFATSGVYAIRYLMSSNDELPLRRAKFDIGSSVFAYTGIFFGCLGMITGMEWATVTWGEPWSNDPKQVGAALTLLSYLAYAVLRNTIKDEDQKQRLSSVYNIFALALLYPLLFIIPAHSKSLHPGTDGSNFEALYTQSKYLRKVSLPGMVGWICLGVWIANLYIRLYWHKWQMVYHKDRQLEQQSPAMLHKIDKELNS